MNRAGMISMDAERAGHAPITEAENAAPPAFLDIFQAEYSYVVNSLRRLSIKEVDVEDLAHEVFLVVHQKLATFDTSRPLRPWLFGIAFRAASDFRRLARHHREVSHKHLEAEDDARPPDEQLYAHQARALVLRALDDLDLDRRAVLVMCDIDGLAVPEIARTLEIPLNTAYSRLRHARAQFTAAVNKLEKRGER